MSDWKNVQYNNGKMRTSEGGGGGGSSTFAGLDDVSFSDLQNGQVPKYNSTTQKWENADESGGGTVTDVEVDGVSVVNPQTGVAEIELPTPPTIPVTDVEVNGASVVNAQKVAEIKSYKEVTQAEYNALPDSKLNDGILYAIKDSAGADGFPPLIYSDEEREVGVWRDGKPLYQKSKYIASFPSNSWNTISMNISGLDKCVDYRCIVHLSNGAYEDVNYSRADGANSTFYAAILSNGDFWFRSYESLTADGWFTILYTKTTDTAGSGIWTTQGGYAHHYSTTEQVIGTWIDGKPLYEKTINVDFVNGRRDYQHGIQNVDVIFFDDSATFIYAKDKSEFNHFYNAGYNDSAQFVEGYGRFLQQVTRSIVILKANPNVGSNYSAIITLRYTKTTD